MQPDIWDPEDGGVRQRTEDIFNSQKQTSPGEKKGNIDLKKTAISQNNAKKNPFFFTRADPRAKIQNWDTTDLRSPESGICEEVFHIWRRTTQAGRAGKDGGSLSSGWLLLFLRRNLAWWQRTMMHEVWNFEPKFGEENVEEWRRRDAPSL